MRSLVLLAAFVLLLSIIPVNSLMTERDYQLAFTKYVKHYNKHYTTSTFHSHYNTFKHNVDLIDSHNQQTNTTFRMAINAFTDMELTEFAAQYNGWRPAKTDTDMSERVKPVLPEDSVLPTSLDWRKKGAVTAVKDQGQSHYYTHHYHMARTTGRLNSEQITLVAAVFSCVPFVVLLCCVVWCRSVWFVLVVQCDGLNGGCRRHRRQQPDLTVRTAADGLRHTVQQL